MEEKNEVVLLDENLNAVVSATQLQTPKAFEHAFAFSGHMERVQGFAKNLQGLDKENPTAEHAKIARETRLLMVKNRTSAEAVKKARKSDLLIESKLIDNLYGVIANSSQLIEDEYARIEKHAEIQEAARKKELFETRAALLSGLCEPDMYPLDIMSDEAFENLLHGLKLAKKDKEEKARKAEEERIEKERLEAEEQERIREQNEILRKEKEEADRLAEIKRLETEKALKEAQEKLAAERKAAEEKAAREKAAADLLAKQEQDRHDAILKAEREKAAKEKAEADAKLKKEQEEKAALLAQVKAKEEAEKKAEKERQELIAKTERERIAAEKKAAKAPDKEKLQKYLSMQEVGWILTKRPEKLGEEAAAVLADIEAKYEAFKAWAEKQIENM